MSVGVSQPQMVKPVPPKRSVCKCGGGRRTVNVLIWGGLSQCVGVRAEATWSVRAVLMGQKSAEAVVPAGVVRAGKG
jgi:hypothetical protein